MAPKRDIESVSVRPDALVGQKCIITGEIDGQSRKSAEQILIRAGATMEKSLNKKVTLVVLGEKAGPSKLEKIRDLGCDTEVWDDLIERIKGDRAEPADEEDHDDEEDEPELEPVPEKETKAPAKDKSAPKATSKGKAAVKVAPKASASSSNGTDPDYLDGKQVIITGNIPGHERKEAQSMLETAGATFAKSFNKSVEIVIIGTKPGPDKLKKIEDLGVESIEWADLAEKLGLEAAPEKEVPAVEAQGAPDSVEGKTLLITGEINGHTRATAQKVLEGAGVKFAKSLTKSVELVVLGTNAGPDKLKKIAEQSVATCSWEDLIMKLNINAEPGQPPKKAKKT